METLDGHMPCRENLRRPEHMWSMSRKLLELHNFCDHLYNVIAKNYLQDAACVSDCWAGFFHNTMYCIACNTSCATCEDEDTKSTSCSGNQSLRSNQNEENCAAGSVELDNICEPCSSPCVNCVIDSTRVSAGFYNSATVCLPCYADTCTECSQNCTKYQTNKVLRINSCLQACPDGEYNVEDVCAACSTSCQTCEATSNLSDSHIFTFPILRCKNFTRRLHARLRALRVK